MATTERKRLKRLAARYGVPIEAAAAAYHECNQDTKAARELLRVNLLFNQIEEDKPMGQFDSIIKELEAAERTVAQVSEENKRLKLENEWAKKEHDSKCNQLELHRDALLKEVKLLTYERDKALGDLAGANHLIDKLQHGYASGKERNKIAQLEKEVLFYAQAAFAGDDLKA